MTKLKSMFLLLRDRKNGRFAAAGCPVRLGDWAGPSFTYDQNIKEMEAGRKERGDQRGTLAKIRGEICVLSEMVILADHSSL
ncbi:hypothetical protein [Pseudomonas syringae]|nr:hypothetical protein [Pseudomonas syringae]